MTKNPSQQLHELFKAEWNDTLKEHPELATFTGFPGLNDRWTDHSFEAIERRRKRTPKVLARLEAIDRAALGEADRLDYDLFHRGLSLDLESHRFPDELLPITQLHGLQQDVGRIVSIMPAFTPKDYENVIARLEGVPRLVQQNLDLLSEGLRRGVVGSRVSVKDVPRQLREQFESEPVKSDLLAAFKRFPETIGARDRRALEKAAVAAVGKKVYPAFRKLHDFVVERYLPETRRTTAWRDLPDGADWYAFKVRHFTSTERTPEDLHRLGLDEVARIRRELESVMKEVGFKKDYAAFSEFLRKSPRFYFTDPAALLTYYRDICKRADAGLVQLFGKLPRLPYGVKPVPEYAAKSAPTAYYQPGSLAGGRAGWYLANTYDLKSRPKWEMVALTLHEAVPGHHLQIALAQEMTELPEFRRHGHHIAFIEGWALYAESLGLEMGMYTDPYDRVGQLNYECWRASRLVVDTGLHWLRWSRKQSIDFLAANTAKPVHDLTVEVERYIAMPAQALAYKVGELAIKALRARATRALGGKFDLRSFHDALLENAALPLDLLEQHIERWIGSRQAV